MGNFTRLFAFTSLCVAAAATPSLAYDFQVDGIYYNYADDDSTCTVVAGDKNYKGNVVVPSEVIFDGKSYTVADIEDMAFYSCKKLNSVSLPSTVGHIGNSAFRGCIAMESITLPNSLTYVAENVFWGCTALKSVIVPESVTLIKSYAFNNCSALTTVTLPSNLTEIGWSAFAGCEALAEVKSLNPEPPECAHEGSFANYTATLLVPKGSISKYQNAFAWSKFTTIKEIEVTGVGSVDDNELSIQAHNGSVIVSGAEGQNVSIYGIDGKTAFSKALYDDEPVKLCPGIYVVKAGNHYAKIRIGK